MSEKSNKPTTPQPAGDNSVFQKNKWVISVSIIAVLILTALILYFSICSPDIETVSDRESSSDAASLKTEELSRQLEAPSDAQAGENNSEIKAQITPDKITGKYIDDSDGWYHEFVYAPSEQYDGTFSAGFDPSHPSYSINSQTAKTFSGYWKLESGEIKLYSDSGYLYSIFTCGEYLVDNLNYFVGNVPKEGEPFMSAFICKAGESGDTQILSFYPDGKFILEIRKNDGTTDNPDSQTTGHLDAGTYEKTEDKIIATINGSSQEYYIVEDGLAKWIYHKSQ